MGDFDGCLVTKCFATTPLDVSRSTIRSSSLLKLMNERDKYSLDAKPKKLQMVHYSFLQLRYLTFLGPRRLYNFGFGPFES